MCPPAFELFRYFVDKTRSDEDAKVSESVEFLRFPPRYLFHFVRIGLTARLWSVSSIDFCYQLKAIVEHFLSESNAC